MTPMVMRITKMFIQTARFATHPYTLRVQICEMQKPAQAKSIGQTA